MSESKRGKKGLWQIGPGMPKPKKKPAGVRAWTVTRKKYGFELEDIFSTRKQAAEFMKDCFEPKHEARVIRVLITEVRP